MSRFSLIIALFLLSQFSYADVSVGLQAWQEQNWDLAASEFLKDENQDNAEVQYRLGYLYLWGRGVNKDIKHGIQWITKAADQKHVEAAYALGHLYFEGALIEQNKIVSSLYFGQCAVHGYLPCMKPYAHSLYEGHQGEPNYIEALFYLDVYRRFVTKDISDESLRSELMINLAESQRRLVAEQVRKVTDSLNKGNLIDEKDLKLLNASTQPVSIKVIDKARAYELLQQCGRDVPANMLSPWNPDQNHIKALISHYSKAADLHPVACCSAPKIISIFDYNLQIAGFMKNNKRVIYINAINKSDWVNKGLEPIVNCSGGDRYWGAIFDAETQLFSDMAINGG